MLGPEHVYYLVSDAHTEFTHGREVLGKPFRESFPDAVTSVLPILDRVYQRDQPFRAERQRVVWDRENRGEPIEGYHNHYFHPLHGRDGKVEGVIAAAIDVTASVRSEAATQEAVQRLEQERELREHFVATLSHDLRSPLAAAKIASQLLFRKASDPVELLKLAGRIAENIDRVEQMISDLLDVSRINAGQKLPIEIEACELRSLAADTLDNLATIHSDCFALRAEEEIHGFLSCSGIRRVLENLCSNAIKYGAPDQPMTVSIRRDDEQVLIEVHNQGPPIPAEDQALLFEPFRRSRSESNSSKRGWGLGLALVAGIAAAHGGSVAVESSAQQGTTFRVALPLDARTASG
jgi:signal transduction histidine kinase